MTENNMLNKHDQLGLSGSWLISAGISLHGFDHRYLSTLHREHHREQRTAQKANQIN